MEFLIGKLSSSFLPYLLQGNLGTQYFGQVNNTPAVHFTNNAFLQNNIYSMITTAGIATQPIRIREMQMKSK